VIISMAHVTPAFAARRKSETRRFWKPSHAKRFQAGQVCDAWSASPRNVSADPELLGTFEVLEPPFEQPLGDCDFRAIYEPEGFGYMDDEHQSLLLATLWWTLSGETPYVLRFKILTVAPGSFERYCTDDAVDRYRGKLLELLPPGKKGPVLRHGDTALYRCPQCSGRHRSFHDVLRCVELFGHDRRKG